jgi:hypothetical protein
MILFLVLLLLVAFFQIARFLLFPLWRPLTTRAGCWFAVVLITFYCAGWWGLVPLVGPAFVVAFAAEGRARQRAYRAKNATETTTRAAA